MGAGGSPAHNGKSTDEQGIRAGSIPDSPIKWEGWAGKRSVRFGHRQCSLRCDVFKRTAAPADAKTCKSAEPQLLAAKTKTERQEISRGSALVSQPKKAASVVVGSSWRRLSLFYFPRGRRTFLRNTQEHHRMTGSFPNPSGRLQPQVLFCVVWRN